jgi:hypothetical protein
MPGGVSLVACYITLLPVLPERVLPERVLPERQVPERQVPEPVRVQAPERVLRPSGVQPASALLPSCSQPLRRKTSRRKAGRE